MDTVEQFNTFFADVYARILKMEERAVSRGFGERLSVTEMNIIEKIGEREPSRMSEVSAALGVTMATLTVACDRLESKGFVLRVRDGKDRRVVNLSLSDTGRAAYAFHKKYHARMMEAMMEEFTPEQAGLLAVSLQKLQTFLDKHQEEAEDADE